MKRTAINRLYEDKVTGELSAERFSKMLTNYENEQSELRKHCELLHLTVIEERESSENASRFIKMVRQFTEMQALTDEIVSTLIERIEVGEAEKFNGQRRQTIKIVYNFIGEIPSDTE